VAERLILPVILNPIQEAQRLREIQLQEAPKYGSVSVKAIFHNGFCRRLEVKRKTAKLLEIRSAEKGVKTVSTSISRISSGKDSAVIYKNFQILPGINAIILSLTFASISSSCGLCGTGTHQLFPMSVVVSLFPPWFLIGSQRKII
jgi:hypothetical protein